MSGHVINVGNFKGGVGKTTTSTLFAYELSKTGRKTLVLDFDPQANATDILLRTAGLELPERTIYSGLKAKKLDDCIINIKENLDLIPANLDLVGFPLFLNEISNNDLKNRAYYLDFLLRPLREEYDYIIIDVPPTISDFTNNAIVASDYVLIVMQTQERSLSATEKFIPYLEQMVETYDANIGLLGIVPVLIKDKGSVDQYILDEARKEFGDDLLNSTIKLRERIKRFDVQGITEEDIHDKRALQLFNDLTMELIERVES
ncbi:ParA family protein [Bacillus halotolerans]|uniref:ParA family protein n=1 Tax=Bacillus halotolerans TaxID=260554 RepID=UPI00404A1EED